MPPPLMPKVLLITPFHPDIGGGSAHLRKLLPHFKALEVEWLYFGSQPSTFPNAHSLGPNLIGGPLLRDLPRSLALWSGLPSSHLQRHLQSILDRKANGCWIVAMNECIPLGNLLRARSSLPLHVSVQDDQADGIAGRSKRYWWLAPLMRNAWLKLLRNASSIDVISEPMARYYSTRYGLTSTVVHPYLPDRYRQPIEGEDSTALRVGHIGNLYSQREFLAFLHAFGRTARKLGKVPELVLVGGGSLDRARLQAALGETGTICDFPSLDEAAAIAHLATCQMLYAMYPFAPNAKVFRQTSLPTKLSTYLQCHRPVFAHTPLDSSLATLVQDHHLGVTCDDLAEDAMVPKIQALLSSPPPPGHFEVIKSSLYGPDNVTKLEAAIFGAIGKAEGRLER